MTRSQATEPMTIRLARWVSDLRYEDLPPSVVAMAKRCALDQLGLQLRGATLPHVQPVVSLVREMEAAPDARITGAQFRTSTAYAAYLNGVFGHSCEFDDCHMYAWHPGTVVIPTALAVAEKTGSGGRDLLTAIVAGYQVMAILGGPMREGLHAAGWHGVKVLGPLGAAAVAGKLMGLTVEQLAQAMAIAASDSSGPMEYDQSGGEVKRLHPGAAARSGVQAAELAARGFTGPLTVIEGLRGIFRLFAGNEDPDVARFWARDFHILDTFFKLRPSVATIHAPLDAIGALVAEHGFGADDVASIEVGLVSYAVAHGASIYRPHDMLSAQFSLAFGVGLQLRRGATTLQDYLDPASWRDPSILETGDLVRAYAMDFEPGEPLLGSRVKVTLTDGRIFEYHQRAFHGHAENPATDGDIEHKFRAVLAGLAVDPEPIIARVASLETREVGIGTLLDC